MSTAELYLSQDEIDEFIRETKIAPQLFYGDEGAEYGVCPYITFYIYHGREDFLPLCHEVIELHQELQTLIDRPFLRVYNSRWGSWVKATPQKLGRDLLQEHAQWTLKKGFRDFVVKATDKESPAASARWAISAEVSECPEMNYTTVKMTFRDQWYRDGNNRHVWHAFVEKWLNRLHPIQCYSGYEIGTTTTGVFGAYESDVMERICADYFYGLDIDHAFRMGFHPHDDKKGYVNHGRLGAGLRTPTWCFLLSPFWLQKLGKRPSEVRMALKHPAIKITEIPYPHGKHNPNGDSALWIRMGELHLYPVDEGVPELPMLANALIKPIRCNWLQLFTLDPWEGDPNPRFDFENGPKWMARFDEDSEWPNREARQKPATPEGAK
ncbi:MAG: DUF3396 domain-containing protein [Zoogloeaceae bacterium]|nr:DUF3396 domain-containing protein [Zoogloeaceae bacterium]